jgi:outer membrane protein TolC
VLIAGMPHAAGGQGTTPTDTVRLSLEGAVRRALEESEEIALARSQVAQAEAQVSQATSAALPYLGTSLTYNRAIRTIFDAVSPPPADTTRIPEAFDTSLSPYDRYRVLSELLTQDMIAGLFQGLPFGRRNTYIAAVQLSQPLFAGGRIFGGIDAARHGLVAAELRFEAAEEDVALSVHTAYLNAVLTRRLEQIAVEGLRVAEQHMRQVAAFYESGTASEFDLLRARVDLMNREPELLRIRNAARLADLELKRLVNLPADAEVLLTTDRTLPDVVVDEGRLRELAARRPSLQAAREAVSMSEAGVQVARAARWPTVQLVGNFGFQAFPSNVLPPGYGEWRSDWAIALTVSWTPFDGFATRARVAAAQAQHRQARLQQQQLEELLETQVEAALGEYRTALAQLRARREAVTMAERAHRLAEVRFANGLATQLEVSDAAFQLDQARVNEVRAAHDYLNALAQLERLSGGRLGLLTEQGP